MADTAEAVVGRPPRAARLFTTAARDRPLFAGMGLQIEGPNSSTQITTDGSRSPDSATLSAMA